MVKWSIENNNRIYGLDILRAFAILNVIYEHGYILINQTKWEFPNYNLLVFDGVSIFFVLSGYLIGGILIKLIEQTNFRKKEILHFWIRRWFRTLPNYFFILTILGLYYYFSNMIKLQDILKYYLFIQNLYFPIDWFFPESWSLSIEEWFYLLVPIILLFFLKAVKNKKKAIVLTVIFVISFVTMFRFYKTIGTQDYSLKYWDLYFRKQVITRLDSIMYGVLMSFLLFYKKEWWLKKKVFLFWLGLIILVASKYFFEFTDNIFYNNIFSFSVISIGTALLIPYLSTVKKGGGNVFNLLTFISIISYSMYLINLRLVQNIMLPITFKILHINVDIQNSYFLLFRFLMYLFYTIFFSYLIYLFWERPTTRLREKF